MQLITRMDKVGGAQKHVEALAIQLKQDGHEVTIVTGHYDASLWRLQEKQIEVVSIPTMQRAIHFTKDIQALWQVHNTFKKIQPHIIAAHSSKAGVIGRIVSGLLRIPIIFTAHSWSFTEGVPSKKQWMYRQLEKTVQPFTTRIITVSDYDRQLALTQRVVPAYKMLTIHNGIEQLKMAIAASRVRNEQPQMIMVARFEVPKRQDILLEILLELSDIPWHLQFVGDGSLRPQLENYVQNKGLSERVTFLGNQLDVPTLLAQSQIFVLLSDWEGLPISIIEAMRAGLPIVATNVGGVNELVTDYDNGFLIPHDDRRVLKKRLQQLLTDATLCQKMGNASERHFLRNFTFSPMYQKTVSIYEQAVSKVANKRD